MTKETYDKAYKIDHDIEVLKEIQYEQQQNHWVGFRIPCKSEVDAFWNVEIRNDFESFINAELEKAQKMFDEV